MGIPAPHIEDVVTGYLRRHEARPDKGEPAHTHVDIRYLLRTWGTPEVTLQAEEAAGAEWCGPSQLGDPVLRARVLALEPGMVTKPSAAHG